jgi:hypothetical protein
MFQNNFAMIVEFVSILSVSTWILINIYAPCTPKGRHDFLNWFHNIDIPKETDSLIVGDSNLFRRPIDRNKLGGNIYDMLSFNAVMSNLRIEELKLHGNKYT